MIPEWFELFECSVLVPNQDAFSHRRSTFEIPQDGCGKAHYFGYRQLVLVRQIAEKSVLVWPKLDPLKSFGGRGDRRNSYFLRD
jgi:hypothetical protein